MQNNRNCSKKFQLKTGQLLQLDDETPPGIKIPRLDAKIWNEYLKLK